MDFTVIQDFISAVGFPIGCCVYMMITMNKTLKQNTEAVNSLTSAISTMLHERGEHESEIKITRGVNE